MNNLKVKFGFFSLLAVLAVSVFLTACEQEQVTEQVPTDNEYLANQAIGPEFMLPYGYDELSDKEEREYLDALDPKTTAELVESAKIADYFMYIGKYDLLKSNSKHGDIFNQNTLSSYLTSNEVQAFAKIDFQSNVESRWLWSCGDWFNVGDPCVCYCASYYYGVCKDIRCGQLQKKDCNNRPDKRRYVESYDFVSCYR